MKVFLQLRAIVFNIIWIGIFITLCNMCVSDHYEGASDTKIERYQTMIIDQSVIEAELSNEYTERTIKILKVPVKTYEFNYIFTVQDIPYTGTLDLQKLPEDTRIKIYYLKDNPNIISLDPYKDLEIEQEKGTSNADLYWGILWGFLAVFSILSLILKFRGEEQKPKQTLHKASPPVSTVPTDQSPENTRTLSEDKPLINKEDHSRFMPR
ncbi:hypothetical protein J8281_18180 [Aquimarina sp. U1-2]|uniref:hypothetical protein n=1 Tax=Aquimarina sp. U1-2 TaxID=2823141 RepID=UPI001AECD592|nr:hypothetical protein [Aquimarina sp. U1-2]MBP2834131.1 hypothetical protein [Aquimarina sp. U1-2]